MNERPLDPGNLSNDRMAVFVEGANLNGSGEGRCSRCDGTGQVEVEDEYEY